jgi:hypothetical protein
VALINNRSFPNEYVASRESFTSTGNDHGFGFNAALLRITNRSAKSVYITLGSTTGGTTGGHEIGSSEDIQFYDIGTGVAGLSYAASSSGVGLCIGAWG